MEKMPFSDNRFDVLTGRFSLHYVENLDRVYEEFNRVLKSKGVLIFTVHHPFLGFMQLGAKKYDTHEMVKMELYHSVTIQFPHHTLKNYFPDKFFEHFVINFLDEEKRKDAEYPNRWGIPGFIGFRAIKKY
jgi:ubiquinone/menaquinone biosynthesis C-methylase UbiE